MTQDKLLRELNIDFIPEYWTEFYDEVIENKAEGLSALLDADKIEGIIDEFGVLVPYKDEIISAAEEIRKNEALSLFMLLLARGRDRMDYTVEIQMPKGEGAAYRFYMLLALLPTVRETVQILRDRKVSEEIIHNTLLEYDASVYIYSLHNKKNGFNYRFFMWLLLHLTPGKLIRIGSFNFEVVDSFNDPVWVLKNKEGRLCVLSDGEKIHRSGQVFGSTDCDDEDGAFETAVSETEDAYIGFPADENGLIKKEKLMLPKKDWEVVFRKGDSTVGVHIPKGGDLSREACEKSYDMAREFFEKHYPEHNYRMFSCGSWMMSRQLKGILKPTSNIVAFLDKYTPYSIKSSGRAVFTFVFYFPDGTKLAEIDYSELSENTSLEREIKKLYMGGGRIYECGGMFLK